MPRKILTDQPEGRRITLQSVLQDTFTNLIESHYFSIPETIQLDDEDPRQAPFIDPDTEGRELRSGELFFSTPILVANRGTTTVRVSVEIVGEDGVVTSIAPNVQLPAQEVLSLQPGLSLFKRNFTDPNAAGMILRAKATLPGVVTVTATLNEREALEHALDTETDVTDLPPPPPAPEALNVVTVSPLDGAIDVTTDVTLTITLNRIATTGSLELRRWEDDALVEAFNVNSGSVTTSFKPVDSLSFAQRYYIAANNVRAADGGLLTLAKGVWDFTAAEQPPALPLSVSAFIPSDNTTGVDLRPTISITLDRTASAGIFEIRRFDNDALVAAFDASTIGSTTSYQPPTNLPGLTEFYIVPNGVVAADGGTLTFGKGDWSWTTGDSTPMTIVSTVPADNEPFATADTTIVFTLSHQPNQGFIILRDSLANPVQSFDLSTTIGVSIAEASPFWTVTLTPTAELDPDTYHLTWAGVRSANGNSLADNSTNTLYNFTVPDTVIPDGLSAEQWANMTFVLDTSPEII